MYSNNFFVPKGGESREERTCDDQNQSKTSESKYSVSMFLSPSLATITYQKIKTLKFLS